MDHFAAREGQQPPPSFSQPATAPTESLPPGLPWGLVLVLSIVTVGIFGVIWMFVEATYAHKLRTNSKPLLFYGIGIPLIFIAAVLSTNVDTKAVALFLRLAGSVLAIAGHFSIKNALEDYYNRVEPIHLQLSGVMTFFFNVLYFQYHLSEIRKWQMTGEGALGSGIPSFRDAEPKKGIIYTPSELDAMRNQSPEQ